MSQPHVCVRGTNGGTLQSPLLNDTENALIEQDKPQCAELLHMRSFISSVKMNESGCQIYSLIITHFQ